MQHRSAGYLLVRRVQVTLRLRPKTSHRPGGTVCRVDQVQQPIHTVVLTAQRLCLSTTDLPFTLKQTQKHLRTQVLPAMECLARRYPNLIPSLMTPPFIAASLTVILLRHTGMSMTTAEFTHNTVLKHMKTTGNLKTTHKYIMRILKCILLCVVDKWRCPAFSDNSSGR